MKTFGTTAISAVLWSDEIFQAVELPGRTGLKQAAEEIYERAVQVSEQAPLAVGVWHSIEFETNLVTID